MCVSMYSVFVEIIVPLSSRIASGVDFVRGTQSATVDFTSLRTRVSVMRVRKREACSESCGNNLITHANAPREAKRNQQASKSVMTSTTSYMNLDPDIQNSTLVWINKSVE